MYVMHRMGESQLLRVIIICYHAQVSRVETTGWDLVLCFA